VNAIALSGFGLFFQGFSQFFAWLGHLACTFWKNL